MWRRKVPLLTSLTATKHGNLKVLRDNKWAAPSEFVSSSIPSWQILTAHAQPLRRARDLAFCLKVPLDSLLVWASSGGSGETARMRRLAWTFAARIGDKYQIRLARPKWRLQVTSWENMSYANNKDANQPAHPRSLFIAFVVRWLASCYIRNFKTLACFCSWAGQFHSYLVANPEDRLSVDEAHMSRDMTKPTKWVWVFAGRTAIVGFVMSRLNYILSGVFYSCWLGEFFKGRLVYFVFFKQKFLYANDRPNATLCA